MRNVLIHECSILLRIKHFQESRWGTSVNSGELEGIMNIGSPWGICFEITDQLVHFVKQDHGIARLRTSNGLKPGSSDTFSVKECITCSSLPGIAPTYVLLWPRMSASSRIPPREILQTREWNTSKDKKESLTARTFCPAIARWLERRKFCQRQVDLQSYDQILYD